MKASRNNCRNMNHGKVNPPIAFCPNCGERFTSRTGSGGRCDEEAHRARRKDRNLFCLDCGKDLNK